jgi:hypothetical protein
MKHLKSIIVYALLYSAGGCAILVQLSFGAFAQAKAELTSSLDCLPGEPSEIDKANDKAARQTKQQAVEQQDHKIPSGKVAAAPSSTTSIFSIKPCPKRK